MSSLSKVALAALAGCLSAALLGACAADDVIAAAPSPATPRAEMKMSTGLTDVRDVVVTGYRANSGRDLTLEFLAGDPRCYAVATAQVSESRDEVAVKVQVGKLPTPQGECAPGEQPVQLTTVMQVSLGDRTVVKLP
ncbi:hypothetical protein JT358_06695 [Micrococcales bacterium 31B]|nr:hypothetical protein [Micrococcales bacterium 31B]